MFLPEMTSGHFQPAPPVRRTREPYSTIFGGWYGCLPSRSRSCFRGFSIGSHLLPFWGFGRPGKGRPAGFGFAKPSRRESKTQAESILGLCRAAAIRDAGVPSLTDALLPAPGAGVRPHVVRTWNALRGFICIRIAEASVPGNTVRPAFTALRANTGRAASERPRPSPRACESPPPRCSSGGWQRSRTRNRD